jgi:hypothetical protein
MKMAGTSPAMAKEDFLDITLFYHIERALSRTKFF